MKIGTKSVLWGVHQFLWHPWTVGRAWRHIYGTWPTFDTWVCIFCHDLGYLGCPNMDGPEGEKHPERGADLARMFIYWKYWLLRRDKKIATYTSQFAYDFTLGHSAHYADKYLKGERSMLYLADKACILEEPEWFYLLRARASGEINEYRTAQNPEWTEEFWLNWYKNRISNKVIAYKIEYD